MEPLTILALVSNVVQLVDAAANAYKVCHEIHQLGSAIEDSRMSYTTQQLRNTYSALVGSLQSNPNALRHNNDLNELALQCCETARRLQGMLDSLCKSPMGGKRESISEYIAKKRKAKEIAGFKSRLDDFQKALDSNILINLRHLVPRIPMR